MDNLTKKQNINLGKMNKEITEKTDKLIHSAFREMVRRSNEMAIEKGFWDKDKRMLKFAISCGDEYMYEYIDSKIISQKLALIASEAAESINAQRNKGMTDKKDIERWNNEEGLNPEFFSAIVKDTVEDELADTIIRIFDFCGEYGIDIYNHIKGKMKYNATREKKHGAKF